MVVGIDEQRLFERSLANERVASPRQNFVVLAHDLDDLEGQLFHSGPGSGSRHESAALMRPSRTNSAHVIKPTRDHMKPGLRGRYRVQSPKSRVDTSTIGNVIRIPCSTAMLRA